MRQQPVVSERDAPCPRRIVERDHDEQAAPLKRARDEGAQRAEMDDGEARERDPAWSAAGRRFQSHQAATTSGSRGATLIVRRFARANLYKKRLSTLATIGSARDV